MSVTWLPREMGLVVKCNGKGCTEKFHTGNIMATHTRAWLAKQGWGRGLRAGTIYELGTKRNDYCPTCMPLEREALKNQKAEHEAEKARRKEARKAERGEAARKAKEQLDAMAAAASAPKPRKKRSVSSSATPSPSPSADSAPAPAS